jgi:hypothetical protein
LVHEEVSGRGNACFPSVQNLSSSSLLPRKVKLKYEELHNSYSSPNIIRMTKSWRKGWAGHVACMGRKEMRTEFWWKSQKERNQ